MSSGNYGKMHSDYLQQEYPEKYKTMMKTGGLVKYTKYLQRVDKEAETLYLKTREQLMEKNPAPDTDSQTELTQYHNWIDRTAREVVLTEVVYQIK